MPAREDLLTPVPGANPAGAWLRYESVYDRIKEARREDPYGDPPVRADWRQVVELTGSAIAKQSKDLQLAAWFAEALLRREGISGLRQGLELIQQLLEQFWDHLYPPVEDGDVEMRVAPLAWVGGLEAPVLLAPITSAGHSYADYRSARAVPTRDEAEANEQKRAQREAAIAEGKVDPETFEKAFTATPKSWYRQLISDVDSSLAVVAALNQLGETQYPDVAPSFQPLRRALQDVRMAAAQLLARKLEQDPDPVDAVPVSANEEIEAANDVPVLSLTPSSRVDAAQRIAAAARFLRAEAPTDPAPYLMLRGFRWGELRAGGQHIDPLLLAAPPTELRTRLKTMLLRAQWRELLEAAEDVMATPYGRGWLDLQRYVLSACEGLGSGYVAVADSIKGALRALLRDLPSLLDATLMDDLPTANAETRAWLRANGLESTGEAAEPTPDRAFEPAAVESVDHLLQRLGTNQPQRAIELLLRAAAQEKSERARFLRRSEAARIMVASGLEAIAVPILQELTDAIDTHQLESWEAGDTVAQPLGLLYRCLQKLDGDGATREALYLRVCRLDPLQAMQFENSGSSDHAGN